MAMPRMMGVFGMLAIALMVFVLRQTSDDARWAGIEKYVKVAFWGTNIGLAMMVMMSLFPRRRAAGLGRGQNGYWHARSLDYIGSGRSRLIEWLRLPGDLVFIVFGAVPAGDRVDQGLSRGSAGNSTRAGRGDKELTRRPRVPIHRRFRGIVMACIRHRHPRPSRRFERGRYRLERLDRRSLGRDAVAARVVARRQRERAAEVVREK